MNTAFIGLIEGLAEAIAAWGKGYFGAESDRTGNRKKYIVTGYGLSALSKVLMALSVFPLILLLARLGDRMGKGIRSAPRDAMLAQEATAENHGRIFGYHRAMDTIGAAIGPAFTFLLLSYFKNSIGEIFLWAIAPGVAGWIITFFIQERSHPKITGKKIKWYQPLSYIFNASGKYRTIVSGLGLFSLFNPTDFLLILFFKHAGFSDAGVIGCYILYNLIYALASYPAGILADKMGPSPLILMGMMVFGLVYIGLSFSTTEPAILIFTGLYGIYAALTDGNSKAWISKMIPPTEKGIGIGCMQSIQSIGAIISGLVFGAIIEYTGFTVAFQIIGIGSLSIMLFLTFILSQKNEDSHPVL